MCIFPFLPCLLLLHFYQLFVKPPQRLLLFYTTHGVLKERILKWFAIPSSSGPHFVRTLHYHCPSWVALCHMAQSFTKLHNPLRHNKAVIHEGEKALMLGKIEAKRRRWQRMR